MQAGEAQAICTAPLTKEALHAAGHNIPGHTELLAHLTGTPEVSMMLVSPKLRVIHVTTHIGLIDAIAQIEPGLVERVIARGARRAGEGRHREPEDRRLRASIRMRARTACSATARRRRRSRRRSRPAARGAGTCEGPLPADTLFFLAGRGDYDMVVAMYHDQGHGPIKVLGLEAGVNITVGLPVIRTSVDHGTAFDIAGTGVADERSLIEALRQAVDLAPKAAPASA